MNDILSIDQLADIAYSTVDIQTIGSIVSKIDTLTDRLTTTIVNAIIKECLKEPDLRIVLEVIVEDKTRIKLSYSSPKCETLSFETLNKHSRNGRNVKFKVSGVNYHFPDEYNVATIYICDSEGKQEIDVFEPVSVIIGSLREEVTQRKAMIIETEANNVILGYFKSELKK